MHLCFIDESGSPPSEKQTERVRYFVIAGLIMHEAQWHGVFQDINKLRQKPRFSVSGEIKWRYFGPDNTDKDNSVRHLNQAARDAFRLELFSIVTKRKSLRIVSCVANTQLAYQKGYVKTPDDI